MTLSSKVSEPPPYQPLPPPPQSPPPLHQQQYHRQGYILVPIYIPTAFRLRFRFCHRWRRYLISAVFLLLLAAALYIVWPSNPEVKIVRLHLRRIRIHTIPRISLHINLDVIVKVRNRDLYSMDYDSLKVGIGYRGNQLGFVQSDHGRIKAFGLSYVHAKLELDGVEILSDALYFLEDLARGSVPFDTVSQVSGQLGLLFFQLPLKAKVSCEVYVNTRNQTIQRQNCYPE